jgi:hypothetical protein
MRGVSPKRFFPLSPFRRLARFGRFVQRSLRHSYSATFRSVRSHDKLFLRACLFRYEMAIVLRADRDPAGRG